MPFDGTGIYNPPAAPAFPAVGGTVIQAEYYNTVVRDLAAGLTNTLKRDGQGAWIGPQNAGGQKLTGLGMGTLDRDAVTLKQLRDMVAAGTGTIATNTMVAPASGEAQVGVQYTGTESVYLFSNSLSYGVYSATGGILIDYERASGKKRLGGTIDIATLVRNNGAVYGIDISGKAATATAADSATSAEDSAKLGGVAAALYAKKTDLPGAPTTLFAQTGYRVHSDGFIEQWGYVANSGTTVNVSFPIAFTDACYNVVTQLVDNSINYQSTTVSVPTKTGFTVRGDGATAGIFWRALGK